MKTLVYTVYDQKVERYLQPFFMQTKGAALRAWMDAVRDPKTSFNKHPEDYTLFEIGEYDEETGSFLNHNTPVSCGKAIEFIQQEIN